METMWSYKMEQTSNFGARPVKTTISEPKYERRPQMLTPEEFEAKMKELLDTIPVVPDKIKACAIIKEKIGGVKTRIEECFKKTGGGGI